MACLSVAQMSPPTLCCSPWTPQWQVWEAPSFQVKRWEIIGCYGIVRNVKKRKTLIVNRGRVHVRFASLVFT